MMTRKRATAPTQVTMILLRIDLTLYLAVLFVACVAFINICFRTETRVDI